MKDKPMCLNNKTIAGDHSFSPVGEKVEKLWREEFMEKFWKNFVAWSGREE